MTVRHRRWSENTGPAGKTPGQPGAGARVSPTGPGETANCRHLFIAIWMPKLITAPITQTTIEMISILVPLGLPWTMYTIPTMQPIPEQRWQGSSQGQRGPNQSGQGSWV